MTTNNNNSTIIKQEEITFKINEFSNYFLVNGYFKPLNIHVKRSIFKDEPLLVSLNQLESSKELNISKEILTDQINKIFLQYQEYINKRITVINNYNNFVK